MPGKFVAAALLVALTTCNLVGATGPTEIAKDEFSQVRTFAENHPIGRWLLVGFLGLMSIAVGAADGIARAGGLGGSSARNLGAFTAALLITVLVWPPQSIDIPTIAKMGLICFLICSGIYTVPSVLIRLWAMSARSSK